MKKGISLIVLSVSILVVMILASVLVVSLNKNYTQAQKIELATELDMLQTAVENYKSSTGYYPITDEILDISEIPDELKNTQFNKEELSSDNSFNVIDYDLIGVDNLKYGTGETYDDKFIVSTKTGKVYYAKGLKVGNETYYSMNSELNGLISGNSALEKNSEEEIVFKEDKSSSEFRVITYVPISYTVNSVKFENESIDLTNITESYYVYELIPRKIGTIIVDYNNGSKEKKAKHIIYDIDLNSDTSTKKLYTLTFDPNTGVCEIDSIIQTEGYEIELPTPTKVGYDFLGWYTDKTSGQKVVYTKMPGLSQNLYAHWKASTYTLVYNANGGNVEPASKIVTYDSAYGALVTPTRTGYTFNGWFTSLDGGNEVTETMIVKTPNDHTIYAHWTANNYTVTYDVNGGNSLNPSSKDVTYDSTYGTLPDPTRDGYTFNGWFTSEDDGNRVISSTVVKTPNNHTIYAHWTANTYTVNYSGNGATSGSTASSSHTYDVAKNLTANGYTKAYTVTFNHNYSGSTNTTRTATYTFNGWATSSGGEVEYTNSQSVTNLTSVDGGTVTLYAKWTSSEVNYTPTRTGYIFSGWYENSSCTGSRVDNNGAYTPTANKTLYAKWTAITYTIKYYQGNNSTIAGSTELSGTTSCTYDQNVTLQEYLGTAPSGWTFVGWSTSQDGTSVSVVNNVTLTNQATLKNFTSTANAVVNLYAVFNRTINVYSGISKATNNSQIQYYNPYLTTKVTAINLATPAGITNWTALGYRVDMSATTASQAVGGVTPSYDVTPTYYAVYSRKYTAHFYSGVNNATDKTKDSSETYYNTNTATVPTTASITLESQANSSDISNWSELGWRDDQTVSSNEYNYSGTVTVAFGTNFYSVYSRTLTIEYAANGGSGTVSSTTKTVYLNANSTATSDQTVTLSNTTFSRSGYTFSKWRIGSTDYNKNTSYNPNLAYNTSSWTVTATAQWTPNEYTLTYDPNGGICTVTSKKVTFASTYGTLTTPTRDGYTFLGWYTEKDEGTAIVDSTVVAIPNDHTIYAHWKKRDPFTIRFDTNEGYFTPYYSTAMWQNYYAGNTILYPENPLRNDYNFLGWYTEIEGGEKFEYETMPDISPATSINLYAHWEEKPVIWFTNGPYIEGTYYISCTRTSATIPAGSTVYYSVQFYGDSRDTTSASASITLGGNSMYSDYNVSSTKSVSDSFYVSSSSSLSMSCMAGSYICGNSNCQGTSIGVTITKVVASDGTEYALKRTSSGSCTYDD